MVTTCVYIPTQLPWRVNIPGKMNQLFFVYKCIKQSTFGKHFIVIIKEKSNFWRSFSSESSSDDTYSWMMTEIDITWIMKVNPETRRAL